MGSGLTIKILRPVMALPLCSGRSRTTPMTRAAFAIAAFLLLPEASAAWLDLASEPDAAVEIGNPRSILVGAKESELLLRHGWAVSETWPGEGFRFVWADGPESLLRVSLARPRRLRVVLRAAPLNYAGSPAQTVEVVINDRPAASFELPPGGFADHTFETPADVWHYGDNDVLLRWGWLRAPRDVDPSSRDPRTLAAAVVSLTFEEISGRPSRPPPLAIREGVLLLGGDHAAAFFLRVPSGAVVEGSVGREKALSALGASGLAIVSIRVDGEPETVLALRALSAFGADPLSFRADLSRWAGRVARLSLRVEAAAPGLTARWNEPRIELSRATPAPGARAALGLHEPPPRDPVPRTAAGHPHVILYLMDALRARTLGCYGNPALTSPFIDRLARHGSVATRNVSQAPNTPPSIKALLTGRYLPYTANAPLGPDIPTLAQLFAEGGYRTGAFCNSPWPAAVGALRGFDTVPLDLYFKEDVPKDFAGRITDALTHWATADETAPLFAYAHSIHPHNPYTPPAPFDAIERHEIAIEVCGDTRTLLEIQHGAWSLRPGEIAELARAYGNDVLYDDHEIHRLAARLASSGRWDDTVFALVSDHGDELAEHGGMLHGWTPYSEMIETPVVLHGPGVPPGRSSDGVTETIDLPATLVALAGLPPIPGGEGRSLLGAMTGADAPRVRAHSSASSAPGIYTVVDGRYKYVFAPRNGLEVGIGEGIARIRERFYLFDEQADPRELTNIVHERPILAAYLERMRASWLEATGGSPPAPGSADDCPGCSDETRRMLKELGYLQ